MFRSCVLTCVALAIVSPVCGQEPVKVRIGNHAAWRHAGTGKLAYTPKGDWLITAGDGIRIWDTATGKMIRHINHGYFEWMALAGPNGKQIVTCNSHNPTWSIRLLDLADGNLLAEKKLNTFDPSCIAVSPDGSILAVGNWNMEVELYSLPNLVLIHTVAGLPKDAPPANKVDQNEQINRIIRAVAFSPDGRMLATAAAKGVVSVYDLATKKELRRFEKFSYAAALTFSPGNQLWMCGVLTTHPQGGVVLLEVDPATGKESTQVKPMFQMYPPSISPDGKLVAYAPFQGEVAVWSLTEKRNVFHCKSLGDPHLAMAFSPDGKTLSVACAGLRMFEVGSWRDLRTPEAHVGAIVDAKFTPDGAHIITTSRDTTTRLWDAHTGKQIHIFEGHIRNVECLALAADGKTAATGDSFGWIHLWDVPGRKSLARFKNNPLYYGVFGLSFSPDGTQLAAGESIEKTVNIYDVKTQKKVRLLRGYQGQEGQRVLCWSPDGRTLVGSGIWAENENKQWGTALLLWNPAKELPIERISRFAGRIGNISFAPDGEAVAFWTEGTVRIVDTRNGKVVRALPDMRSGPTAYSADGRFFFAGGILWEYASGTKLHDFGREFVAVHFDRTGRRLLTADARQTYVEVWDIPRLVKKD